MARLEIDIVGNNTELKKVLADSKIALSNFNKELEKGSSSKAKSEIESLRVALAAQKVETEAARTAAVNLASTIKNSLAESFNNAKKNTEQAKQATETYKQSVLGAKASVEAGKQAITDNNLALIAQRKATEESRTATQQARQAMAELALANRQSKSAVDVASGSYREAQQRLTAMGKAIREAGNGFDLNNPKVRKAVNEYNALNNKLKEFDKTMGNNQRNVGNYGSAFASAIPFVGQFTSVAGAASAGVMALQKSFSQNIAMDAFKTALREISGSSQEADKNLDFLRKTSERLGLDFMSTAQAFKQWQGAAKFSNLTADESRKIFESVANASAKMKLSSDQTTGAFLALSQMLSKGKVQAEELRGQLGERLPGAFSLAAKAIGVTEQQLNKMLEKGEVIANDFLPKFADQLDKSFGNDQNKKIESMQAEVNRLKNAWDNLFNSDSATTFFKDISKGLADTVTEFDKTINSKSWKEFFLRLGGNVSTGITSTLMGAAADAQRYGGQVTPFQRAVGKNVGGFTDLSNEKKKLQIQEQQAVVTRLSKEYNEKKDKETLSRLTYQNATLAEMNRLYYSQLETKKNINNLDAGGGGAKGKSQAELIKEANDALKGGQTDNLKGIDNELAKIDKKWDSILDKINKIANVELKNQLKVQVDQGRELDKQLAKLDAWAKTKLDVNAITRSGTISPTLSGLPSIDNLKNSNAGFVAGLSQKFEDKEAEQLQKEISRIVKGGVRRGFDDIIGNIDDLGSNFYQVFTNVFGKLAGSIQNVFNDLLGNQLGNLLKDGFGDFQFKGLSKELSQGIIAGVGALGSVLGGLFKSTSEAGQGLSGALSGAATGAAAGSVIPGIGTVVGGIVGGLIGALSGIFGAKERKRQLELQEEQLKEQRKQTLLQERANALAYSSSIIGQMSNRGIVQGVDVNEFGELVFRIEGRDLVASMTKEQEAQKRGL